MIKKLIELIVLEFRPLKHCKGKGCYVYTQYRSDDGRPVCSYCKAENTELYE